MNQSITVDTIYNMFVVSVVVGGIRPPHGGKVHSIIVKYIFHIRHALSS